MTKDLFEVELSDGTFVQAWEDADLTFISIRFVTLAIPTKQFKELCKVLSDYRRKIQPNDLAV